MNPSPTEKLFAKLILDFTREPGVELAAGRKSFGAGTLKFRGKIFAMVVSADRFVVKLPRERVAGATATGEGKPFDPGHGRLMKEWLEVQKPDLKLARALAREALDFASGAAAKPSTPAAPKKKSASAAKTPSPPADVRAYNDSRAPADEKICALLAKEIDRALPEAENKVWHAHPVWFLDGNPVVGYSKQKRGIRLMFWSGAGFDEPGLDVVGGKFKDASLFYASVDAIDLADLRRWLAKARDIQWDYKNIVKRKGKLERLK